MTWASDLSYLSFAVLCLAATGGLLWLTVRRERRERADAAQADQRHEWARRWHLLECRRMRLLIRREEREFE